MPKSPLDAEVNTSVVRFDQPIILACRRDLAEIRPVRLALQSGGFQAGQALARVTSTGVFDKYAAVSGAAHDSNCILMDPIGLNDQPATGGALAKAIFSGRVYTSKIVGSDATFITELGGKAQTDARNISITKF